MTISNAVLTPQQTLRVPSLRFIRPLRLPNQQQSFLYAMMEGGCVCCSPLHPYSLICNTGRHRFRAHTRCCTLLGNSPPILLSHHRQSSLKSTHLRPQTMFYLHVRMAKCGLTLLRSMWDRLTWGPPTSHAPNGRMCRHGWTKPSRQCALSLVSTLPTLQSCHLHGHCPARRGAGRGGQPWCVGGVYSAHEGWDQH